MYIHRDWEHHAGDALLSYLDRTETPVRDRTGRVLDGARTESFLSKTENKKYVEHWVFTPRNGEELTKKEISIAVRKTMREHLGDGKRATYCFAVHNDVETNHAHIAMTGQENDMMMDAEKYAEMRRIGARETREVERDREHGREIEQERLSDPFRGHDREQERKEREEREAEPEPKQDRDPDRDRDLDPERGYYRHD